MAEVGRAGSRRRHADQEALARLAARDPPRLRLSRGRLHGHLRAQRDREQSHRGLGRRQLQIDGARDHVPPRLPGRRPTPSRSARRRRRRLGTPTRTFRAGDEIRLDYANGAKVTAIGDTDHDAGRTRRFFIGVANWLHTTRARTAWKYIADVYAVLLALPRDLRHLHDQGRARPQVARHVLRGCGLMVPISYVVLSGGPEAQPDEEEPEKVATAAEIVPETGSAEVKPLPPDDPDPGSAVLKPLPSDDEE